MARSARQITPKTKVAVKHYEQPLSERMRTFLRLEFLYQQILYNSKREADWAIRTTISILLEALAILSRGDLRSDVHKEFDHQLGVFERYQSQPKDRKFYFSLTAGRAEEAQKDRNARIPSGPEAMNCFIRGRIYGCNFLHAHSKVIAGKSGQIIYDPERVRSFCMSPPVY